MTELGISLLSIGHSNVSLERFLGLLRLHEVDVVADVRSTPRSRYVPHFDSEPLRTALAENNVRYVFLGDELGGRPDGDEFYDLDGHVLYDRRAESQHFQAGLERLIHGARTFRVASLCSEEDPLYCHRRLLIARVLASRGVEVIHIRGDGRLEGECELSTRERKAQQQAALFDAPPKERPWRSIRSVSPRRAPLSSSGR